MTQEQAKELKSLAEIYLKLLISTRGNPGWEALIPSTLGTLRDLIAERYKADAEYVQNSFELVADTMRQ